MDTPILIIVSEGRVVTVQSEHPLRYIVLSTDISQEDKEFLSIVGQQEPVLEVTYSTSSELDEFSAEFLNGLADNFPKD